MIAVGSLHKQELLDIMEQTITRSIEIEQQMNKRDETYKILSKDYNRLIEILQSQDKHNETTMTVLKEKIMNDPKYRIYEEQRYLIIS